MFFVDIQAKNKNIWIISKRVGVILRIQGAKDSAAFAVLWRAKAAYADATSGQEGSSEIL